MVSSIRQMLRNLSVAIFYFLLVIAMNNLFCSITILTISGYKSMGEMVGLIGSKNLLKLIRIVGPVFLEIAL